MAKKPSKTISRLTVGEFDRGDWLPFDELLAHVERIKGGWPMMRIDIVMMLLSVEMRWVNRHTFPDGTIELRQLAAADILRLSVKKQDDGSIDEMFALRADVHRFWPGFAAAKPSMPHGGGAPRKYDREKILREAAAYIVENDLPPTLEKLVHCLQAIPGNEMPQETLAKEILSPLYRRMKAALGRDR
jgi:hypothetical protein